MSIQESKGEGTRLRAYGDNRREEVPSSLTETTNPPIEYMREKNRISKGKSGAGTTTQGENSRVFPLVGRGRGWLISSKKIKER